MRGERCQNSGNLDVLPCVTIFLKKVAFMTLFKKFSSVPSYMIGQ